MTTKRRQEVGAGERDAVVREWLRARRALRAAQVRGDLDAQSVWAGRVARLNREVGPAMRRAIREVGS